MFIFSNLAMSLDGKIATSKRTLFLLGTRYDRENMQVLRKQSDAILMGASTLRSVKEPCKSTDTKKSPLNILLSSNLERISHHWPYFTEKKTQRVLFVGPNAPSARLRKFAKTSEIILLARSTRKNPTSSQIIGHLKKRGIKRLLIEGGGGVMWDFVNSNSIDEYHVTVTPRIIGGHLSPTLVDGQGFLPQQTLNIQLKQCRIIGHELYLIYRKTI